MSKLTHEELKSHWASVIFKQRESGQTVAQWCKENQIARQTFYAWQKKLFPIPINRAAFTEITANNQTGTGISLEYFGIHIELQSNFDSLTLKKCLKTLKEMTC